MKFEVKVIPKSSKNEVAGFLAGVLKVKICAPPEKGKANKELISFLSIYFGVSKSAVKLVSGEKSRNKIIEIEGLDEKKFRGLVNGSC